MVNKRRRKSVQYASAQRRKGPRTQGWRVDVVSVCLDPACGCVGAPQRPSPLWLGALTTARLPEESTGQPKIGQKQEPGTALTVPGSTDVDLSGVERGRSADSAR